MGLNSGEVVVGAIGERRWSYTAVGHTVGLAQRMEQLAEPGKAYLTEDTAALVRGFLALEDLGEFEVKGASRPLRVYELAGVGDARTRLDLSRARGFSRFVGRDEEMTVLEEALERAKAGEGAVVGIVAEPGVGKSRLCHEFAERCRASGIPVYDAQAPRTGATMPFMPVLQLLRTYFGITERTRSGSRARRSPADAAARPRLRRRPAADLRLPRRARPRAAAAAADAEARAAGAARRRLHA